MSWAKARNALTTKVWFTKKSGNADNGNEQQSSPVIVRSMDSDESNGDGCWPELKEFCRAHIIECSAFALFILFGFFCILNAFGFVGPSELKIRYDHYEQILTEHCQFVEDRDLFGTEGQTAHPNATLISLMAVIRHGDRYGLIISGECQVQTEQEQKEYKELVDTVNRLNLRSLVDIPEDVADMVKIPEDSCQSTTLTPRGAIQGFAVGRYLYQKYKNTRLFDTSENPINLTVTFSHLQRTVASAVAVVSGFLDQNSTVFKTPIPFKQASFYYGCTDPGCECDENMILLQQTIKKERQGLFRLEADSKTQETAHKMFAMINYTKVNLDPAEIVDHMVTSFTCARKPLPCNEDFCANFLFFGDMLEFVKAQIKKMFELDMSVFRRQQVLSAYPVLRYLDMMAQEEPGQMQFFANHDTIISAILRILTNSGENSDWQIYATRLVFEVYQTSPNNQRFFRVTHDGIDVTSTIHFCKDLEFGLCPISSLRSFVAKGIFEMAGYDNFKEACTESRALSLFV